MYINIEGSIQTKATHDEWVDDFIIWLESRGENFGGVTEEVKDDVQDLLSKPDGTTEGVDYHRGIF